MNTKTLEVIKESLIAGSIYDVDRLVRQGMDQGILAKEILDHALIPGMDVVGQRMESGEMYIPEVLRCAKVMGEALEILRPHLSEGDAVSSGKVIIGTVKGDVHDIGKNLVGIMLRSAGFDVHDLGTDVSPEEFVTSVKEQRPDLLGLSALLTTTLPMIDQILEALRKAGVREQVKIMIGGAPVTQSFAEHVGADGYASDAGSATKLAKRLLS